MSFFTTNTRLFSEKQGRKGNIGKNTPYSNIGCRRRSVILKSMRKLKGIPAIFPNLNITYCDNSQDNILNIHPSGKIGEFFHGRGKKLDVRRKLKYNVACKSVKGRPRRMVKWGGRFPLGLPLNPDAAVQAG